MYDLTKDTVWKHAADLIREKYGRSLSYRAIRLISDKSAHDNQVFYSSGDDLIIPLRAKNVSLGDVIVSRGTFLEIQQKEEIADLVKFLVEPKLYNAQLKQSEEFLEDRVRPGLSLVSEESEMSDLFDAQQTKRKTLSQVIMLKSHTELSRNRVALKMHEMSERNLFVHLDDIIKTLSSKEDLATLTDITIYVNDIEQLSVATLRLLQDYLETAAEDGPLFLLGSNLSMDAIEEKDWPESLKKDLLGFYFDIDRVPVAQQTSEDILELLFFKFDQMLS